MPLKQTYYTKNNCYEKETPLHDWIDVGVYTKGYGEDDSLIYITKKLITKEKQHFDIWVKQKPTKAGIDPLHKLIDRDTEDNLKKIDGV